LLVVLDEDQLNDRFWLRLLKNSGFGIRSEISCLLNCVVHPRWERDRLKKVKHRPGAAEASTDTFLGDLSLAKLKSPIFSVFGLASFSTASAINGLPRMNHLFGMSILWQ